MVFEAYRLPDGQVVNVDATASKGAAVIGFTLKGGRIVDAVLVTVDRCALCGGPRDSFHKNHAYQPERRVANRRAVSGVGGRRKTDARTWRCAPCGETFTDTWRGVGVCPMCGTNSAD